VLSQGSTVQDMGMVPVRELLATLMVPSRCACVHIGARAWCVRVCVCVCARFVCGLVCVCVCVCTAASPDRTTRVAPRACRSASCSRAAAALQLPPPAPGPSPP
jgi:hypothetical protein